MKRILINLSVALSLLLFIAVCIIWVRSYWRNDYVARVTNAIGSDGRPYYEVRGISSQVGRITLYFSYHGGGSYVGPETSFTSRIADSSAINDIGWQVAPERKHFGILRWYRSSHKHSSGVDTNECVQVSYWFLALTTSLVSVLAWRARSRFPSSCCAKCGYDLRATPDRCPECGMHRTEAPIAPNQGVARFESNRATPPETKIRVLKNLCVGQTMAYEFGVARIDAQTRNALVFYREVEFPGIGRMQRNATPRY
jgi:hypothetical protein